MVSFSDTDPFGDKNVSFHGTQYLGVQEIGRLAQVCKKYRAWASDPNCVIVWKNASIHDKIPFVAGKGLAGKGRDYKEDLKVIRPLLSSVHGLLGSILGPVPPICEKVFRKFMQNDADRYGDGYFRDNFVLFIDPSYIERHVDKETPLALQDGKLIEIEPSEVEEQVLVVEATLPNLLMLFKYPLKGKEHLPVYRIDKDLLKAVREQCVDFPEVVGVGFMRENIPKESKNKQFDLQKPLVETNATCEGNIVKSVRERLLVDGERILKKGKCSDVKEPECTDARGTETVNIWGGVRRLVVGGFVPGIGVWVSDSPPSTSPIKGSALCLVVRRKFPGHWNLDTWQVAKASDFLVFFYPLTYSRFFV